MSNQHNRPNRSQIQRNLPPYGDGGFAADSDGYQGYGEPVRSKRGTGRRRREMMERMRAAAAVLGGAGLLAAAIGGAAYFSRGHSPAYDKKTEAGLEKVIKPELTTMGNLAIRLSHEGEVGIVSKIKDTGKNGVTEYFGSGTGKGFDGTLDVVMRNNAQGQPIPDQTLVGFAESDSGNLNTGPSSIDSVEFVAAGGAKYASSGVGDVGNGHIYAVDNGGWTGYASSISSINGVVQEGLGGTIDSADATYFGVDNSGNPLGAVGTAKNAVASAPTVIGEAVTNIRQNPV